jgi:nucleotide-binding universal stress UspA family protein
MAMSAVRNIFVPFHPERDGETSAALEYAAALASQTGAHLTARVLGLHVDAPYSLAPMFTASLANPANDEEKARVDKAAERATQRLTSEGITHDTVSVQRGFAQLVDLAAFFGRLHDFSVVDSTTEHVALGRALIEELMFHTGRPVIIVPPGSRRFTARRIVIAWDGSPRAARAANDAMPFLRAAEHVELVSVVNEKDLTRTVPGAEMAPHLDRHGIKAHVVDVVARDGDAGAALRERAEIVSADMLVMGGFSHSRWRQLVLGGVTSSMLQSATLPLFVSH